MDAARFHTLVAPLLQQDDLNIYDSLQLHALFRTHAKSTVQEGVLLLSTERL
jgi:hypothetical protein